jgi:KDO2-lipid IV(A) lauroyltransferase
VVFTNLRNSFPEKSKKEINKIAKRFYLHLSDLFFESLYLIRMGPDEILRRYRLENNEALNDLYAQGKDIIVMMGHYANWEWSCSAWRQIPFHTIGVYKPLMNKLFDRFFIHLRTKYSAAISPMKTTFRAVAASKNNKDYFAVLLMGDQRPAPHEINVWINFLNQDTPVILGAEKMAKKFDSPIVFLDVMPEKRGYYKVTTEIIVENPKEMADHEITKKFFRILEKQIKNCPEYYLWSHKRWKYTQEGIEEHMKKQRLKK